MLEFIEYPKCSTCKKAKNELDQLGLDYQDIHIVEETPSEEVILNWQAYVVYPLIEESEALDFKNLTEGYDYEIGRASCRERV